MSATSEQSERVAKRLFQGRRPRVSLLVGRCRVLLMSQLLLVVVLARRVEPRRVFSHCF
jgi:hypothetical protein